jgi:hypothetical protein
METQIANPRDGRMFRKAVAGLFLCDTACRRGGGMFAVSVNEWVGRTLLPKD